MAQRHSRTNISFKKSINYDKSAKIALEIEFVYPSIPIMNTVVKSIFEFDSQANLNLFSSGHQCT